MNKRRNPNGYWNYDRVKIEATKYKSRSEFQRKSCTAYRLARNNGWLDEWFGYKYNQWNYESAKRESQKYNSRKEFQKGCGGAYHASRKNGWLDEFTWLRDARLNWEDGIDNVYIYHFVETDAVYVGRSVKLKDRDKAHVYDTKYDTVAKYAHEHGYSVPKMKIIETGLTLEQGQEREDYWKKYYHNKGYIILNKAKTGKGIGSLGSLGYGKWNTKEKIKLEANKYSSRREFEKGCPGAYHIACKKGWLNEWFGYKYNQWDYKKVEKEATKYNSISQFERGCPGAYRLARNNGWLDKWFERKWEQKWDYQSVKEEALKYNSKSEFYKGCGSAYNVARNNGWLDEWFKSKYKYWDYNSVKLEADKYKSRTDFAHGSKGAYMAAYRNKTENGIRWLDILFPKNKTSKVYAK